MKQSPFETFACVGYELEKIIQPTQLELTTGGLSSLVDVSNVIGDPVKMLFSNITFNPSAFAHPIDVNVFNTREGQPSNIVVVDGRPFTKVARNGLFDITKHPEYDLTRRRAILHAIWRSSDRYMLQGAISPLMQLYAAWISESLAKHLSIDAMTQLKIANIAAWWFWCQCYTKETLTDDRRAKIIREIGEATRSSYETVEADLDGIEYFDDLEHFCAEVKERTGSTRIKHLDPASVLQLCSGSWIGTWSREIMTVAVEYPPYLAAVVYTAMHERGMRSAMFAKFVQRYDTRPEVKGFKNSIERLCSDGS